jgi:hypothetical protein
MPPSPHPLTLNWTRLISEINTLANLRLMSALKSKKIITLSSLRSGDGGRGAYMVQHGQNQK